MGTVCSWPERTPSGLIGLSGTISGWPGSALVAPLLASLICHSRSSLPSSRLAMPRSDSPATGT